MELTTGNYGSPRWSYEILDCAMPMTFDTYSNCAHQCLYCFSFFQRAVGTSAEDYLSHKVRSVDVERVKRMFTNPEKYGGQFKNYIKRRMTLQWGGLSDGFDWYEKKFGKSLELLTFFNEIDYPLSISTKGVWYVYDDEYRKQLRDRKNLHFKYSIITDIEEHVKAIEPGVPSARDRFAALKELNKLGVAATTLRFRPFIIGTSDLCIESMMKSASDAGCYSITTELLCWESRASDTSRDRLDRLSKVLGYDVWKFYNEQSARSSGLLRLNYDLKRPYILEMKEAAEKYGLKFFVSDAHHKEESYHAGCCGLPETGALSNVNRGQYAHAIKIAKEKGIVKWSDIKEEAKALLEDIPLVRAEGFNIGTTGEATKRTYQSVFDFMHDIWNNPTSWQSPARYFGGALVPGQPDENGDIVYLYNKPFIELNVRVESVNDLAKELRMTGAPNAQRYNEMTADGTDYGYTAYPIYIFSRKRSADASTPLVLRSARLNYHFVVSKDDLDAYADQFPEADIIVVPQRNSIRAARQFILEQAREEGYPYIWMLDDDIDSVKQNGKPVSMRALLSSLERWVEDYSNVALLGVNGNRAKFVVNQIPAGLLLVNTMTGISFTGFEYKEVEAFALQHFKKENWVTVCNGEFTISFKEIQGGGAAHIITAELQDHQYSKKLFERYREYFNEAKEFQPNTIRNSIRSRHVEAMIKE